MNFCCFYFDQRRSFFVNYVAVVKKPIIFTNFNNYYKKWNATPTVKPYYADFFGGVLNHFNFDDNIILLGIAMMINILFSTICKKS